MPCSSSPAPKSPSRWQRRGVRPHTGQQLLVALLDLVRRSGCQIVLSACLGPIHQPLASAKPIDKPLRPPLFPFPPQKPQFAQMMGVTQLSYARHNGRSRGLIPER